MRRILSLLLVAGSGAVLAACTPANVPAANTASGASPKSASLGAVVDLNYGAFAPAAVHIKAGQAVEWKWIPPYFPNDVAGPGFHSKVQTKGVFIHVFNHPGAYPYRSDFSHNAKGVVYVGK